MRKLNVRFENEKDFEETGNRSNEKYRDELEKLYNKEN